MSKTLVNIVTDDNPIPAYLFIKEKYEPGDRLMFISAKSTEDDLQNLSRLFHVPEGDIESILLRYNDDEITYEKICRVVNARLMQDRDKNNTYFVNLAGGTRYMALAVQQVFEKFHPTYFYVHVKNNVIVQTIYDDSINDNDDRFEPIRHRMSIAEYLEAHGIQHNLDEHPSFHSPIRSKEDVTYIFQLFAGQQLGRLHKTLDTLRKDYRNRSSLDIGEAMATGVNGSAVPALSQCLTKMHFKPETEGVLSQRELEYLTGGWFEEYTYYLVKENLQTDDLALNVLIAREGMNINQNNNELDVVFIMNNKLFVIECKTGVQGLGTFNGIVYKLCAIREALLGMSCHSYIFSLRDDVKGDWERVARNMGSTFVDRSILTSPPDMDWIWIGMKDKA